MSQRGKRSRPNRRAAAHQEVIHFEALTRAKNLGLPLPAIPQSHRVELRMRHLVGKRDNQNLVEVGVYDLGPWPKGHRKGNRQDLDNMVQIILDALQGVFFANDNQVTSIILSREAAHQ